jgi:hypothetical protein
MPPLASEFRASLIRLEFHIRNEGFDEFFFLLFFSFIYLFILLWTMSFIIHAKSLINFKISIFFLWTWMILGSNQGCQFCFGRCLFFQLEWNVLVSECFDVPFRGCNVCIYIYIYIYIFNKHSSNSR